MSKDQLAEGTGDGVWSWDTVLVKELLWEVESGLSLHHLTLPCNIQLFQDRSCYITVCGAHDGGLLSHLIGSQCCCEKVQSEMLPIKKEQWQCLAQCRTISKNSLRRSFPATWSGIYENVYFNSQSFSTLILSHPLSQPLLLFSCSKCFFFFFFLWVNQLTKRVLCLQSLLLLSPICSTSITSRRFFSCKHSAGSVICLPPSSLLLRKRSCTGGVVTSKRFSSSIVSLQLRWPTGTLSERYVRNGNMISWANLSKWQK